MTRLISSCIALRPRGSLATSISSTSGPRSPSSSRGASRSATTTSASISALRPAMLISSGSPGPPPTSDDARRTVALAGGGDDALAHLLEDLVADPGRALRLAVAQHRDRDAVVAAGRGVQRGGLGAVVGADAEHPSRLGRGADLLVDGGVVRRRDAVPGLVEVGVREAALVPGDLAGAHQALDRRGHLRRHHVHVGADGDQLRHPPLGHVAAADDDDAAIGEPEPGGVRREVVHRSIIACRPISDRWQRVRWPDYGRDRSPTALGDRMPRWTVRSPRTPTTCCPPYRPSR